MKIIICGGTSVGKDFGYSYLLNKYDLDKVTSITTRPMRQGEEQGREYHFISKKECAEFNDVGLLFEIREYVTLFEDREDYWHYATPYCELKDKGKPKLLITDLTGAAYFKQYFDDVVVIYISTDDDIREQRARNRGSFCSTEFSRRLQADAADFLEKEVIRVCDYYVNNNDDEATFKQDLDNIMLLILGEENEL